MRRVLHRLLAGCLALLLTACGPTGGSVPTDAWAASPYTDEQLNQSDTLSMRTGADSYPVGSESVLVLLANSGEEEAGYGVEYTLEKQTEDGWKVVPFRDDASWIEIGVILPAGGENEEKLDLTLLDLPSGAECAAGSYRVIKQVGGAVLAAPFRLVEQAEEQPGPVEQNPVT